MQRWDFTHNSVMRNANRLNGMPFFITSSEPSSMANPFLKKAHMWEPNCDMHSTNESDISQTLYLILVKIRRSCVS